MRFAVLAENETLEDLAARVYDVSGAGPTALRDAGRALVEANPFLRKIDEVPAGTLVMVPPLAGVEASAAAYPADRLPAAALAAQLRGAVALARRRLSSEIDAEIAEATETANLARSREAKAAARDNPELRDELPKLAEAAAARAESAHALQQYQTHAFARIEADIEDLLTSFGSASEQSSS